jgi:hypothetical protein
MKNIITALALLIGLASCNKYEDNTNTMTDTRSLPSVHFSFNGNDFNFQAPTSYKPWDAMTECDYVQGNLVMEITFGLDGKPYTLPQGKFNGQNFTVNYGTASSTAIILFYNTGQWYPAVFEMVP